MIPNEKTLKRGLSIAWGLDLDLSEVTLQILGRTTVLAVCSVGCGGGLRLSFSGQVVDHFGVEHCLPPPLHHRFEQCIRFGGPARNDEELIGAVEKFASMSVGGGLVQMRFVWLSLAATRGSASGRAGVPADHDDAR